MLDENLPTYRFKQSTENPLNTILYFTHNGSEPSAEYVIKRPAASSAPNQYALGLFDSLSTTIIYSEVLVKPEWSQPTLSAAEVRANNGAPPQTPVIPETFAVSLYNPDQSIPVKLIQGSWGKSDSWEFEIPERTFKLPSASRIDQDADGPTVSELVPKLCFRWKRDGRLSKDMTCYMSGKSVGGNKNKEPDITIGFFRARGGSVLTLYEPNMARVELEDRKGFELFLILSAEVIRDLYLNPRHNPFNAVGASAAAPGRRRNTSPKAAPPTSGPTMSGALGNTRPSSPPPRVSDSPPNKGPDPKARQKAEIDAETERLKAMVAEEERLAREREREKREEEERKRVQKLLDREEKERRKREAEVEQETERLRREYGMVGQDYNNATNSTNPISPTSPTSPSPQLPPRPVFGGPALPQRPVSVGPMPLGQPPYFAGPPTQPQPGPSDSNNNNSNGKKRHGLGGLFQSAAPYAGPAVASVSGFFGNKAEQDKRKKVQKKRSVHF